MTRTVPKKPITEAVYDKWIAALRSGKYKQGQSNLYDPDNNTYCCLGVLARVRRIPREFLEGCGYVPEDTQSVEHVQSQFPNSDGEHQAANWNDTEALTFEQIAKCLNLKKWRKFFLTPPKVSK